MIAVKYIGHRQKFSDVIYGSGIAFAPGQTVNVDDAIARKMLKHADVYERGDMAEADAPVSAPKNPSDDEDPDQTARDAIANMSKDALVTYAKTTFSVDLDKRSSVGDMRTKVTGLYDQYGVE